MSLPPTEPIKETLNNLKMNLPFKEDKELLANSKYLRVHWRKWNMKSNVLQLYLYREEIISRLPNLSFKKKLLYKRRFNLCINEINKFFQMKNIDDDSLENKINKITI